MPALDDPAPTDHARHADAPPRARTFAIGLAVGLAALEAIGTALSPWLLVEAPLLLIALSPSGRHLAMAVLTESAPLIILVATARRVLALAATWLIGAIYGRVAIAWASARFPRVARFITWTEGLLTRFGAPLLVVAPGFTPSLLAGVSGIRFPTFAAAVSVGTAFYCALTVFFGEALAGWTRPILDWLVEHVVGATIVCVVLVSAQQLWSRWRRGRDPGARLP